MNSYSVCDMERALWDDRLLAPNATPLESNSIDSNPIDSNLLLSSERYDLCIFDVPDFTKDSGYIFWDRRRLHDWGVLSKDIRDIGVMDSKVKRDKRDTRRIPAKAPSAPTTIVRTNWEKIKRFVTKEGEYASISSEREHRKVLG